mmetsp:Transcript_50090/g.119175  ORF Transcript_50090/g.119175 Transcript_50090/m.119175 type:complete len:212 (-) Transcript_50090:36-671(-)
MPFISLSPCSFSSSTLSATVFNSTPTGAYGLVVAALLTTTSRWTPRSRTALAVLTRPALSTSFGVEFPREKAAAQTTAVQPASAAAREAASVTSALPVSIPSAVSPAGGVHFPLRVRARGRAPSFSSCPGIKLPVRPPAPSTATTGRPSAAASAAAGAAACKASKACLLASLGEAEASLTKVRGGTIHAPSTSTVTATKAGLRMLLQCYGS